MDTASWTASSVLSSGVSSRCSSSISPTSIAFEKSPDILVAADESDADLDLQHVADARGEQGLELDDGVVDQALSLEGAGERGTGRGRCAP